MAECIHQALTAPFTIHGEDVFLTASVGVTIADTPDTTAANLLRRADQAMYAAKQRRTG